MAFVEKTLRWVVLAGIFSLPVVALIVANGLFFPYITGKNFAFRVIVEIIVGAWLALALVIPAYRPRRSWVLASFALFVVVIALADALGVHPFKSFWSNYERMDGWITLAHTFAYLVVAVSVLNGENLWRRLLQWSLAVSAFLSVLGLLQVIGIFTVGSGGTGLTGRVDATFGNPIYFAAYMLFHIFIAAMLWVQVWNVRKKADRLAPSILYATAILFDTMALLFSGTRGTMLGLIGGAFLALLLYAISGDASRKLRRVTAVVFAGGVILASGLWMARDTTFVNSIGFLGRLASISLTDNTAHARFLNMGIAWQGVKERPILGWGQENYAIVFDKYYDPRMYAQEQWFDRVHDVLFDWWIAGGTLGLLSYLAIFAATLWVLWKRGAFTIAERSILTGLLAGYFVHNLTVFDNVTSYILFATVLGYIAYREAEAHSARPLTEIEVFSRGALPLVAAAATALVLAGAWSLNATALKQNHAIIAAISPPQTGPEQNLAYFKEAVGYGSFGTQEAREQLAQITVQLAPAALSADLKQQFMQTAIQEMELQQKESPLDARFPLFGAQVLFVYGDYKDAAVQFERAHELSPKKQTILFQMAQTAEALGNIPGALRSFKAAYDLDTTYVSARVYYAAELIRAGQESQGQALLAPVIATGQAADPRVSAAYAARNNFAPLIPIWEAAIAVNPAQAQGYFTLAAVYYAAHDAARAIATLQKVGTVIPAAKSEADKYIQQIRTGAITPGQ